jgi:hypothetical protein
VRGIGLVEMEAEDGVPLCLYVDLDSTPERMPEEAFMKNVAGLDLPAIALSALEASAPLKLEYALGLFGLPRA